MAGLPLSTPRGSHDGTSLTLLKPPNHLALLEAARVGIDAEDGADTRPVLALSLDGAFPLTRASSRCHGVASAIWCKRGGLGEARLPRLLEDGWAHAGTIVGSNSSPECGAMRVIDSVQAAKIDIGSRSW